MAPCQADYYLTCKKLSWTLEWKKCCLKWHLLEIFMGWGSRKKGNDVGCCMSTVKPTQSSNLANALWGLLVSHNIKTRQGGNLNKLISGNKNDWKQRNSTQYKGFCWRVLRKQLISFHQWRQTHFLAELWSILEARWQHFLNVKFYIINNYIDFLLWTSWKSRLPWFLNAKYKLFCNIHPRHFPSKPQDGAISWNSKLFNGLSQAFPVWTLHTAHRFTSPEGIFTLEIVSK